MVAEGPHCGKELFTRLATSSYFNLSNVVLAISHFGFVVRILVLIAPRSGHVYLFLLIVG